MVHTQKNLFLKNKKMSFIFLRVTKMQILILNYFQNPLMRKIYPLPMRFILEKYLGIKPGSVSPYALLNDYQNEVCFYLDEKLYKSELINFHPLINTSTITTKTKDFLDFILEKKKKINIFSLDTYSVIKQL